jgi:hypothetical protein
MGVIIMRYCLKGNHDKKVEAIKCDSFNQLIDWLVKNGLQEEKVSTFKKAQKGDYIVFDGIDFLIIPDLIFKQRYMEDVDNGNNT